jgi:hypothetical protein
MAAFLFNLIQATKGQGCQYNYIFLLLPIIGSICSEMIQTIINRKKIIFLQNRINFLTVLIKELFCCITIASRRREMEISIVSRFLGRLRFSEIYFVDGLGFSITRKYSD